jgi:asparagine synthase (glutamine-hydrolysing)
MAHASHLGTLFEKEGLLVLADAANRGMRLWHNTSDRLIVVGAAFQDDGVPLPQRSLDGAPNDAAAAVAWLFKQCWGSYLAVARNEQTAEAWIGRDPGGGLPVNVIEAGGVGVATDQLPAWLAQAIGRPTPINKVMLANALAMPLLTTHRSLLHNVFHVPAGAMLNWRARFGECRQIWTPSSSWAAGDHYPERMRACVFAAAHAWAGIHPRILVELSGGLDSAIVLGALKASGAGQNVAAINLATTYAGGDERELARAAADRFGIELVEFTVRETELDYEPTLEGPQPLQPNLYGLDPILEASVAGAAAAFDGDAIVTGQGGDAIFFQTPSEKVPIDLMRAAGPSALFSEAAFDAARRTRRSIWRMQWLMLRDRIVGTRADRMPVSLYPLGVQARALIDPALGEHPWLNDTELLPPAKQTQILTVANCQLFNGPTRRGAVATLRHPLMSQPVVEAWLAAPTHVLSKGTQDRAFARHLFADLLPPSIARRRGKGETSIYYRRSLVENLDFFRRHLLDGTLVAHGLLDADKVAYLLDEQVMLWSEEARVLPSLASLEAWARYWRL